MNANNLSFMSPRICDMLSFIDFFLNEIYAREQNIQYYVLPTNLNFKTRQYFDDLSRMKEFIQNYMVTNNLDITKVKKENIKNKINISNFEFPWRDSSVKEILNCLDYFYKIFLSGSSNKFLIAPRQENIDFMNKLGYNYYVKGGKTKIVDLNSHKKFVKDFLLHLNVKDFHHDNYEKDKKNKDRENTFIYVFEVKNVKQRFGYPINKSVYLKFEFIYGDINNIKNGYYPTVDTHTSSIIINCKSVILNQISSHTTNPMKGSLKKYQDKLFDDAFQQLKSN